MSGLSCTKLTLLTVAGVAIQLVGLSLFVFGFFPVKPTLPGHRYSLSETKPRKNKKQKLNLFVLFWWVWFKCVNFIDDFSGPESFREPTCNSNRNESQSDVPPHQLRSLYKVCSFVFTLHLGNIWLQKLWVHENIESLLLVWFDMENQDLNLWGIQWMCDRLLCLAM